MGKMGSRKDEVIEFLKEQAEGEKAKQLLKEGIIKMDTGQCEQERQIYLLEEVMRTHELAIALKNRIWDVFVKQGELGTSSKDEAPPHNPIDFAISISRATHSTLKGCLELLEAEIISKLVGN